MSKAFKKGLCTYCGEAVASTADHVIARGFFPVNLRGDLPKVGACIDCNNKKSKLEHTLTAVLPFGARHDRATEALLATESKLAKNQKLHRYLADGYRLAFRSICQWLCVPEMTVPFDSTMLEQLGVYMIKGLARHHWELEFGSDTLVRASFLKPEFSSEFDRFFKGSSKEHVSCNLGQGVFCYEGILSNDSPQLTLWKMSIFGAVVGGDPDNPSVRVSMLYGWTVSKNSNVSIALDKLLGDSTATAL